MLFMLAACSEPQNAVSVGASRLQLPWPLSSWSAVCVWCVCACVRDNDDGATEYQLTGFAAWF